MVAGDDAIRDRRRQRLEHRVDDRHRIGHPPAHRRRARGAHDAAGRHDHLEAAERAVVDRIVGRRGQALVGDLRAGVAGGDAGIVEAAHLLRHVGEVDRHLVALHHDAHLDRHRLADLDAVVVHVGLRLVDAVRDGARARARHRLGVVHDGRDRAEHRVAAVALDQLQEAPLAGLHRRDLRAQVAHGAGRQPHVLADDVDQRLVDHAAVVQLHDRDLQALRRRCRWSCRRACRRCRASAPCSRRSRPACPCGRSAASA